MTALVQSWPSPTRRAERHTYRVPSVVARAELYGLFDGEPQGLEIRWSPAGTGGWTSPAQIQAIVQLVSNPLETASQPSIGLRDQINFSKHYLSLSVADYARLVGVERPAVYAWIEGSNNPRATNFEQINRIFRAATYVKQRLAEPLGARLRLAAGVDKPLYDLLESGAPDSEVESAIDSLGKFPDRAAYAAGPDGRDEESIARARMRALSIAGRRLK